MLLLGLASVGYDEKETEEVWPGEVGKEEVEREGGGVLLLLLLLSVGFITALV